MGRFMGKGNQYIQSRLCTVNYQPSVSNYQLSQMVNVNLMLKIPRDLKVKKIHFIPSIDIYLLTKPFICTQDLVTVFGMSL